MCQGLFIPVFREVQRVKGINVVDRSFPALTQDLYLYIQIKNVNTSVRKCMLNLYPVITPALRLFWMPSIKVLAWSATSRYGSSKLLHTKANSNMCNCSATTKNKLYVPDRCLGEVFRCHPTDFLIGVTFPYHQVLVCALRKWSCILTL